MENTPETDLLFYLKSTHYPPTSKLIYFWNYTYYATLAFYIHFSQIISFKLCFSLEKSALISLSWREGINQLLKQGKHCLLGHGVSGQQLWVAEASRTSSPCRESRNFIQVLTFLKDGGKIRCGALEVTSFLLRLSGRLVCYRNVSKLLLQQSPGW